MSLAMGPMSPLSVAMVNIWLRAEITARLPEGERSKPSASFSMATISISFCFSSVMMSIFTSVVLPEATSNFQMPKSPS